MTWQLQYTQAISTAADHHSFHVYFFDTYLSGKTGWTVSAHPDASEFKRSVSITYPNAMDGGNDATCYFWVNWGSTTNPTQMNWYSDYTYTTTPGDLGTYTSYLAQNNWITNFNNSGASNIKIWQSSERSDAMLVTAGKRVFFFWPGCTEWAIPEPYALTTWDGSGPVAGQGWIRPYTGSNEANMIVYNPMQTTSVSTSGKYAVVPSFGHSASFMNTKYSGGPAIVTGASWMVGNTTHEMSPFGMPAMDASTSDFGYWIPSPSADSTTEDSYYIANGSIEGTLVFDTNTSNYWLQAWPSPSVTGAAFNFGAAEPDFS